MVSFFVWRPVIGPPLKNFMKSRSPHSKPKAVHIAFG